MPTPPMPWRVSYTPARHSHEGQSYEGQAWTRILRQCYTTWPRALEAAQLAWLRGSTDITIKKRTP